MEVIKAGKGSPASADGQLREAVGAIVENVRRHGDEALIRYGRKFDGCRRRSRPPVARSPGRSSRISERLPGIFESLRRPKGTP